jgi:hypothetical protein
MSSQPRAAIDPQRCAPRATGRGAECTDPFHARCCCRSL